MPRTMISPASNRTMDITRRPETGQFGNYS